MTVNEIVNLTGMDSEEAELAKGHSYIVYFLCFSGARDLYREFERRGLKMTRGSHFYHLGSTNDKGIAVHKLTSLYRNLGFIDVVTAGLGDNLNDLPMLSAVNYPFLVESPDNGYAEGVELEVLVKLSGSGPIGWNKGVLQLLQKFDFSD
jgi:predicted mannosyl-3-phosphoglycerate phosphatase (HAD superfamily)